MITTNELETIELGYRLGKKLIKGDVVFLVGDLACGKTTFTKGIGKALNIKQVINSPTFTILKIYHGDLDLYHIDAYRLDKNTYDLGFDEYVDSGIMVVEWPNYYIDYLPKEYILVNFKNIDENKREIIFSTNSCKYKELIEEFTC